MGSGQLRPLDYVSTRGSAPAVSFSEALIGGLAPDGGLYLPAVWPELATTTASDTYVETASEVMWPFVAGTIPEEVFADLVADAYSTFDTAEVAPATELDQDIHLVNLFGGPTLAFKDVALQLLGRLFDYELNRRGERVTVVGATSGDTGSAAIEACKNRSNVDIVILHPANRVSEVQRRQMTTVDAPNVHNVAVEGTFDDCQDLLKAMFADQTFRDEVRLSAVNSINWARVMAQIVYYVYTANRLGSSTTFAVPTGNFGNVFAADAARRMGLEVGGFIVASNRNDILTRFFASGALETSSVEPTLSPSMDIQVSSNLERLLFELYDRNGAVIAELMGTFRSTGTARVSEAAFAKLSGGWVGDCLTDDQTLEVIAKVHREYDLLIDPHTAVALGAAFDRRDEVDGPIAVMATAHPAKFPDAVEKATGIRPALPERLADLFERDERYVTLPNELDTVEDFVRGVTSA